MVDKVCIFFVCSVFVFCESAYVDNLRKCSVNDWECQKSHLQSVLKEISKNGIPEIDIPPTDPYVINNISTSFPDLIDITIFDGVAKGIKDCVVNKCETDLENQHASIEITCDDLTLKSQYKAYGSSPLIKNLLGGSTVRGEGKTKVVIEKLKMKFDYNVLIKERNGETYLYCQYEDLKYSYDLGKITFAANGIFLGDTDATGAVLTLLNDNWKFIVQSFGKPFFHKAMDIIFEYMHKFFQVTPTKYYLTDDLTSFINKD